VDVSFYLQVGVIYLCFVYVDESKLLRDEFRLQTIRKEINKLGRNYMKNLKKLSLIVTALFMMSVSTVFGLPLLTPGAAAATNLTGAVNIDLQQNTLIIAAKNTPNKSSADYICDGIGDQVEINNAINKLAGKAGTVALLSGTFVINKPIVVRENLIIYGQGIGTIISLASGSNCNIIQNTPYKVTPNLTIRDMRLNGNRDQQSSTSTWTTMNGISITVSGANSLIKNMTIENTWSGGIRFVGDNSIITGNTIKNSTWSGISVSDACFGVEISYNSVYDCGAALADGGRGDSITTSNGGNHKIIYNYIKRGGKVEQLGAWQSLNTVISNNRLEDGLAMGIATFSDGIIIKENTVKNAADNGIDLRGANNCLVQNNIVDTVNGYVGERRGIVVIGNGHRILDNQVSNIYGAGIITYSSSDNYIAGNTIKNCGISNAISHGAFYAGIVIQIYSSTDLVNKNTTIINNRVFDDQAVPTTKFGLLLIPSKGTIVNLVVKGNDFIDVSEAGTKIWSRDKVISPVFENNLGTIK
jgi:parallel beta-helix repeat protein